MIFYIKTISRLLIAYKDYITVMLAIRTLINKFRFFKLSRMIGNSINERFTLKRSLIYFLIIE
jgi:hypothetical protein